MYLLNLEPLIKKLLSFFIEIHAQMIVHVKVLELLGIILVGASILFIFFRSKSTEVSDDTDSGIVMSSNISSGGDNPKKKKTLSEKFVEFWADYKGVIAGGLIIIAGIVVSIYVFRDWKSLEKSDITLSEKIVPKELPKTEPIDIPKVSKSITTSGSSTGPILSRAEYMGKLESMQQISTLYRQMALLQNLPDDVAHWNSILKELAQLSSEKTLNAQKLTAISDKFERAVEQVIKK